MYMQRHCGGSSDAHLLKWHHGACVAADAREGVACTRKDVRSTRAPDMRVHSARSAKSSRRSPSRTAHCAA